MLPYHALKKKKKSPSLKCNIHMHESKASQKKANLNYSLQLPVKIPQLPVTMKLCCTVAQDQNGTKTKKAVDLGFSDITKGQNVQMTNFCTNLLKSNVAN